MQANIFVHLGRNNRIWNNVLANATNKEGAGAPLQIEGKLGYTFNNSFERNIVALHRTQTHMLVDGVSGFDEEYMNPHDVRRNIYYPVAHQPDEPGSPPSWWELTDLTPLGNWDAWRAAGYDKDSVIGDPLFVDAANGNFCLQKDSAARELGFEDIPDEVCMC